MQALQNPYQAVNPMQIKEMPNKKRQNKNLNFDSFLGAISTEKQNVF